MEYTRITQLEFYIQSEFHIPLFYVDFSFTVLHFIFNWDLNITKEEHTSDYNT